MKRLLVLALAAAAALSAVQGAWARPGEASDSAGDTRLFDGSAPGPGVLDLVRVAHNDTAESIVYTMTTAAPFTSAQISIVSWLLSFGSQSNCAADLSVRVRNTTGGLIGEVVACRTSGSRTEETLVGPAAVSHAAGSNSLTVSYPRSYFAQAGLPNGSYQYFVDARGSDERQDQAPDGVLLPHDLGAARATSRPGSATSRPVARPATPAASSPKPGTVAVPTAAPTLTPIPFETAPPDDSSKDDSQQRLRLAGAALAILALAGSVLLAAQRRI